MADYQHYYDAEMNAAEARSLIFATGNMLLSGYSDREELAPYVGEMIGKLFEQTYLMEEDANIPPRDLDKIRSDESAHVLLGDVFTEAMDMIWAEHGPAGAVIDPELGRKLGTARNVVGTRLQYVFGQVQQHDLEYSNLDHRVGITSEDFLAGASLPPEGVGKLLADVAQEHIPPAGERDFSQQFESEYLDTLIATLNAAAEDAGAEKGAHAPIRVSMEKLMDAAEVMYLEQYSCLAEEDDPKTIHQRAMAVRQVQISIRRVRGLLADAYLDR
ncbi:MAG TPA: hypothetical protein VLA92_00535, partial [Candidatus Saccharimonadales bacterium]|nr:hypothetical protein [Candidatus Saccharimonadales bacterium]